MMFLLFLVALVVIVGLWVLQNKQGGGATAVTGGIAAVLIIAAWGNTIRSCSGSETFVAVIDEVLGTRMASFVADRFEGGGSVLLITNHTDLKHIKALKKAYSKSVIKRLGEPFTVCEVGPDFLSFDNPSAPSVFAKGYNKDVVNAWLAECSDVKAVISFLGMPPDAKPADFKGGPEWYVWDPNQGSDMSEWLESDVLKIFVDNVLGANPSELQADDADSIFEHYYILKR